MFLAGCFGAQVSNTDQPMGPSMGIADEIEAVTSVEIVQSTPENTGQEVVGVSCKLKLYGPNPTRKSAIEVAKREAASFGYTKLRITSVEEQPAIDVDRNCRKTVIATGIAFN